MNCLLLFILERPASSISCFSIVVELLLIYLFGDETLELLVFQIAMLITLSIDFQSSANDIKTY